MPQASIVRTNTGVATVLLVNNENKVEARAVETGQNHGEQIVIEKGLSPGERVIVSGLQKVQPGMPVTPVETPAAAGGTPARQPEKAE